jgi:DMSO/TMAO reductase YedYZ molybdopterin-dependent catalytic subunit
MAEDLHDDEDGGAPGSVKQKLIDTKERWAAEGRLMTAQPAQPRKAKLPPGQHEVKDWPVLDLGVQPDVTLAHWRLRVGGLVENPLVWDWEIFKAQPQVETQSDMHCVTAWSRFDNHWQGITVQHLLSVVKPKPAARFVILSSYDQYTTNLPLADFAAPDALLVHSWEGKPLTRAHGGPVRALVPRLYLWKSAKWLKRIEFVAEDRPGFWEARGYHNHGDPWRQERYDQL